jgi:hypothetical protein
MERGARSIAGSVVLVLALGAVRRSIRTRGQPMVALTVYELLFGGILRVLQPGQEECLAATTTRMPSKVSLRSAIHVPWSLPVPRAPNMYAFRSGVANGYFGWGRRSVTHHSCFPDAPDFVYSPVRMPSADLKVLLPHGIEARHRHGGLYSLVSGLVLVGRCAVALSWTIQCPKSMTQPWLLLRNTAFADESSHPERNRRGD